MSWMQFTMCVMGSYCSYYAFNFLFDLYRSKEGNQEGHTNEMVLLPIDTSLEANPEFVAVRADQEQAAGLITSLSSGEIESSGGVDLNEIERLARQDLIEYTKAIPF